MKLPDKFVFPQFESYGGRGNLTLYTTKKNMEYFEDVLRVLLDNLEKFSIGVFYWHPVEFFILRRAEEADEVRLSPQDSERVVEGLSIPYSLGEWHLTLNFKKKVSDEMLHLP
jgi:hypothetical protein